MDRLRSTPVRMVAGALAVMGAALALTTLAVAALEGVLQIPDASATYLLAVVSIAVAFGTAAAVATAIGSFLLYDFLFVAPTGAFIVANAEELLNLLLLLALGVVVGQLAGMQRGRAETAVLRERQARTQYQVGRELATAATAREALPGLVRIVGQEVEATRTWIGLGPEVGQERVTADSDPAPGRAAPASYQVLQRVPGDEGTAWVRVHDPRPASGERREPGGVSYRIPITAGGIPLGSLWVVRRRSDGPPGRGHTRVLAAAADQVGQALERDRLADEATGAEIARRSEAAKTALLDSVSHDLRTPLASIRAAAGSLMDPTVPLDEVARMERAASIDAQAERLNRLVTNLLDMSRIEAGGLRARLEVFPLEDLVRATVARFAGQLDGRTVAVSMPSDLPPVSVDEIFIDEVVTNLLENAIRHAPPVVPIQVSAVAQADGTVRLRVEDGGPGVPAAALERVFDKFYRVPTTTDRAQRGSGLGLAVVRGFVEAMGGRVSAHPSDLGGLAVDVMLQPAVSPAPPPAPEGPRPGGGT
ncbi:MAG TPA: ATP-binding protein, partial [Candidatus Limnocylindrales bacterium]